MGEALRGQDGFAQRLASGEAATTGCGECCGPDCPFYWRARNCVLPKCYVYICSDATCKGGGTIGDGTVFEFEAGCYTVLTNVRYVPNPGDGKPPPPGFQFIPKGGLLVEAKEVVCRESCAECHPENCVGGDCIDRPHGYGLVCDVQGKCVATVISGCCDYSGRIEWSGSAEDVFTNERTTWDWYGSLQGFAGGVKKAIKKFYLVRKYYQFGVLKDTKIFDFNAGYETSVDEVCRFSGPENAIGYGWTCPFKFDEGSCTYSHTLNSGSFSASWSYPNGTSARIQEAWTRTPGVGQCGPNCPSEEAGVDPGPSDPNLPRAFVGDGAIRDCPRCLVGSLAGNKCVNCGYCQGCGH